ncbi:DNA cytosine methyltransferase [Massilia sp. TN1-12]|uniref:DNA cytosine methyltransferase n=1 Tax=Massilia paldalensis TaxID=3377675 RepID=UPI00384A7EBB
MNLLQIADPAYYNEIDEYAANWLRNLIAAGHIAPGEVDTRSIEDVHPSDLEGFTQCHFFAGIGVWSLALRRAGWPDDRPVWTGSCPCQPFSAAGQGAGFADERHLWPHFFHLIGERRPAVVLGEQVASKDADAWIDLVQDDLEGVGYRVGSIPFPSAGIGAPHIRDRLYWVANAQVMRREGQRLRAGGRLPTFGAADIGGSGGLADADNGGRLGRRAGQACDGRDPARLEPQRLRDAGRLDDAIGNGRPEGRHANAGNVGQQSAAAGQLQSAGPGPSNGYWRDADWLGCRDGKWRPVEPGTFPLAHGAPARVGRLRAYGNAINAEAARVFIETVMEAA